MGEVILKAKNIFKSYDNGEKTLSVLNDLSIKLKKIKLLLLQDNPDLENQHYLIF